VVLRGRRRARLRVDVVAERVDPVRREVVARGGEAVRERDLRLRGVRAEGRGRGRRRARAARSAAAAARRRGGRGEKNEGGAGTHILLQGSREAGDYSIDPAPIRAKIANPLEAS